MSFSLLVLIPPNILIHRECANADASKALIRYIQWIKKCHLESERKLWMYSFSNPITTATQAAKDLGMSVGTARKGLNRLAEIELLYAEKNIKHNRKYRNYDLIRILN